jgi:type II secretory pathway pseudopilin PulG
MELLIVVAIMAIIAAIAVPSMRSARMAANETAAIQSLRTYGSAQAAFAATNNQMYGTLAQLTDAGNGGYLDNRWAESAAFNGYIFSENQAIPGAPGTAADPAPEGFGCLATPVRPDSTGRYIYGIASDQVVRFIAVAGTASAPACGSAPCAAGSPIGKH